MFDTTVQEIVDSSDANNVYEGVAQIGRSEAEAKWSIRKLVTSGGVTKKMFPIDEKGDPSPERKFVWNDRTGLAWSLSRDTVGPTITSLPNWGTGVDSGTTTAKTVTFGDDKGGVPEAISITASNGASITGFTGSYASCGFNLVAPSNLTEGPITVVVTYSVTDQAGHTTTATQNVLVAPAFVDVIQPIDLTGVNISSPISETVTIANEPVKVIVGNADIGGAVIATTSVFSTDITVTGTSSGVADSYSGDITVQDVEGATAVISIGLVVSEPI